MSIDTMMEYKLIDAESYFNMAETFFNNDDLNSALECYDRAYISYLEVYGNKHQRVTDIYKKVQKTLELIAKNNKN